MGTEIDLYKTGFLFCAKNTTFPHLFKLLPIYDRIWAARKDAPSVVDATLIEY